MNALKMMMLSGGEKKEHDSRRDYDDLRGDGEYDYDRYRHHDGRFAPKPRGDYDGEPVDAFRDWHGRRHYDNGHYAPKNVYGEVDNTIGFVPPRPYPTYPSVEPYGKHEGYTEDERKQMEEHKRNRQHGRAAAIDDYDFEVRGRVGDMDGYASGRIKMPDKMDKKTAEEWVESMRNDDGTMGAHWSFDQAKQIMAQRNIGCDPAEFFAIINAMYSDYSKVSKKHNVNTIDFYADLAKAWIYDDDAVPNKAMVYYECIVK